MSKIDQTRNEKISSFGRYYDFPPIIHGTTKIIHKTSIKKLQRIIAKTLFSINKTKLMRDLSVTGQAGMYNREIGFEVGIANGLYFDYLDDKIFSNLLQYIESSTTLFVFDVLIIVSYHYFKGEKRIPLNFDHNLIRFIFRSRELNLYLYNSRGIRRMPLDEFLNYILKEIREKMKQNHLKTFKVEYFTTL